MKCILCQNSNFKVISKKVRFNIPIRVFECENCSLVSLENPMKNTTDYDDSNYRKKHSPVIGKTLSAQEMFDLELKFQPSRIKRVRELLNSSSNVLEIGSSTGHFLHSIRDMVRETTGIELNSEHAEFAKNNLELNIFDQPLGKAPLEQNSYDVIFMFQVFEHIPNPLEFLKLCKKYLKKSGIIYIEVPNIKDVLLNVYNISQFRDFYFRVPHVYYYSEETLQLILKKAGFQGTVSTSQEYTFFNHIHWLTTRKPQKSKDDAYGMIKLKSPNSSRQIYSVITKFFLSVNKEYKKLLEENGIAENVCYQGSPINQ